jgi:hypothetical protein
MKILYKEGSLFKIDSSQLKPESRTTEIINGLYAAIYSEFKGAVENPRYKNLSIKDRMKAMNDFAESWLNDKGLL